MKGQSTRELPFEAVLREESRALHPGDRSLDEDLTLTESYRRIHERLRPSALCLSGGGIRSATFALGLIQGLARRGLLGAFQYLSTVSGGGYLGGWLTAWIHRHPEGLDGVCRELADREPSTVRHLRSYSNYLSPRFGLLSADTWTLVATYLRNLLLTWSVLVPMLLAVVVGPWLILAAFEAGRAPGAPTWLPAAAAVLGFLLAVVAVAYVNVEQPGAATYLSPPGHGRASRQGESRDQEGFLRFCLAPLVGSALSLTAYWGWSADGSPLPGLPQFVAFVTGAHAIGWLLAIPKRRRLPGPLDGVIVLGSGIVGGIGTWVVVRTVSAGLTADPRLYVCLALPVLLGVFLLAGTAYLGLATSRMQDDEREWAARLGAWVLLAGITWVATSSLVLFGPEWLDGAARLGIPAVGSVSGLLTILLGGSSATPARANGGDGCQKTSSWARRLPALGRMCPKLAAPVFLVCLVPVLSFLLDRLILPRLAAGLDLLLAVGGAAAPGRALGFFATAAGRFSLLAALLALLLLAACAAARCVDVNKYSLHSMYRARLIRAYLGASHTDRRPNRFTGFDAADNLDMAHLRPTDGAGRSRPGLFPVVNCALNLVNGAELAWQERKAEPFTVTPLHSGCARLGYRRSAEYGRRDGHAISLGTAMAISGAAASPNMGYHSSPLVTFLMTLFNARLGWWLGNPGPAGEVTASRSTPKNALRPLVDEALGLTTDQHPYVYLSDGGHFENLGLYEMVRRRCHLIVVSDAACDPGFSLGDLGNAVRKIRIDLGIPIEFPSMPFGLDAEEDRPTGRFAVGIVRYSQVDGRDARDGLLLYVKPVLLGGEPSDVQSYARSSGQFPHETTGDQWFSESQFESYRMLGLHTAETVFKALGAGEKTSLEELERLLLARAYVQPARVAA